MGEEAVSCCLRRRFGEYEDDEDDDGDNEADLFAGDTGSVSTVSDPTSSGKFSSALLPRILYAARS
uniref:Uncharacterized protein n=1 Tax=Nymphaea colorata TaxID=210225 RepID=A0A5K0YJ74_9MAGN|nr:unnamed protein product [Nymphaea colorata]